MEKLLFTGASGFLGKNVKPFLEKIYEVTTVGLTDIDDIKINLAKEIPILNSTYDVVLHAAGKAHVIPKKETDKKLFYDVNLQGTKNLCTSLEKANTIPRALIFISTVAVYGCDFGENITENHPVNGYTPYAISKLMAEEYLQDWCGKNNVILSIIRPSLIAGPNAPGNLGAMVDGIKTGKYLSIAGGKAKKSVLMVQDIANLIPLLVEKGGIYNVCDSNQPSFRQLEWIICRQLGKKRLPVSIPLGIARLMALVGDCFGKWAPFNSLKLKKITTSLTFSNEKARKELNWEPLDVLENYKI